MPSEVKMLWEFEPGVTILAGHGVGISGDCDKEVVFQGWRDSACCGRENGRERQGDGGEAADDRAEGPSSELCPEESCESGTGQVSWCRAVSLWLSFWGSVALLP